MIVSEPIEDQIHVILPPSASMRPVKPHATRAWVVVVAVVVVALLAVALTAFITHRRHEAQQRDQVSRCQALVGDRPVFDRTFQLCLQLQQGD